MDFKQLAYFVEVAECGTFSAAAKKIYVSQPALSKSIKMLGDSLGVRLFYTQNNRTCLTAEGKLLYEQAKKILRECETTVNLLERAKQEISGTVRVVTSCKRKNLEWLTRLITDFFVQNEGAVVELSVKGSRDAKEDLMTGAADVGVLVDSAADSEGFETTVLDCGGYHLLVNEKNPLSQQKDVSFRELEHETFLSYSPGFSTYDALMEGCREYGFEPAIRMMSGQPEVLFAGVEQNLGVAMIAVPISPQEAKAGVACIPIRESQLQFTLVAIVPKDQYRSPVTERFWNFVQERRADSRGELE